jgi:acyl-coenzyme A synthetase/AMP-(fatty) acid ligase
MQMAECTFDMHMQDIVGTLIAGATVIMLHHNGNMDFVYLLSQLQQKQISYIQSVPTYINSLCQYVERQNEERCFEALRSVCSIGN